VAKPIKVYLAQGIVTPTSEVVLGAILECGKVKFAKNFIVCTLDGMEAILVNTFLDIYHVDVFKNSYKLKVIVNTTTIPSFFYWKFWSKSTHFGHA
jgi:hypothetical protein